MSIFLPVLLSALPVLTPCAHNGARPTPQSAEHPFFAGGSPRGSPTKAMAPPSPLRRTSSKMDEDTVPLVTCNRQSTLREVGALKLCLGGRMG